MAVADATTASWVSTTPFGSPVVPLVATTSASPASTGRPPSRQLLAVDVDERRRGHRREQRPAGRRREPGVDREGGVAAVPDPLEGHDERGPGRQGHGDQVRHGSAGYPGAMLAMP